MPCVLFKDARDWHFLLQGAAEEPARVAGASAAGREGTRRSEKAKLSEEALLTRSSKAKKPMNA